LSALLIAIGGTVPIVAGARTDPPSVDARLAKAGKSAALTVYPTRVIDRAIPQVGETVALFLEQRGMANLETSAAAFLPPDGADLAATAKAFGDYVRANPPTTEFALFTDFMGSKEKGFVEVRSMVVNRNGDVMWMDRQVKGDKDFDRLKPREPLQCCTLVVERLKPVLNLTDGSKSAKPGRIAQRWQKATGLPDQAEQDGMHQRLKTFRQKAAISSLQIFPVHAGDKYAPEGAANIAQLLNDAKVTKAAASDTGPQLNITGDINEQKVLWSMARAFSDYVKQNPASGDYVLFADYIMGQDRVGAVHFVICNRQGELVAVDFQNSHHADFKAINPKNRADCDRLVAKRLQTLMR
jgi:hypothetical protein